MSGIQIEVQMNEQFYINNIKEQIRNGTYEHLFRGKRDLVFLDIGANVGLVSLHAVPYCKRIVAVEPSPDVFKVLKDNTRSYQVIECLQAALTPRIGQHEFFVNDVNFTASSTVNTYGKQISVDGTTLSGLLAVCHLNHVDVCKLDIEGGEGEALNFGQIDSAKDIIQTYYIETHNCPKTTWEHKLGTIVGNLARCGYSKMTIEGMAITATRP
jgi:FkbM family methyltransferase